jgi:hypothetical protein
VRRSPRVNFVNFGNFGNFLGVRELRKGEREDAWN